MWWIVLIVIYSIIAYIIAGFILRNIFTPPNRVEDEVLCGIAILMSPVWVPLCIVFFLVFIILTSIPKMIYRDYYADLKDKS